MLDIIPPTTRRQDMDPGGSGQQAPDAGAAHDFEFGIRHPVLHDLNNRFQPAHFQVMRAGTVITPAAHTGGGGGATCW